MQAGVEAADVAQGPGDVGVARLPVGVAIEQGDPADLLVEQRGDAIIEDGVVGDDLFCGVLAGIGGTVDCLVDRLAKGGEFYVQGIDAGHHGGRIVERAGQGALDLIHLLARAVGLLAVFFDHFGPHFRVHGGRPHQDVGGETALGIEIARNVADGPDDLQPSLGDRNLVHGLVFRGGDIDRQPAADGGKRDDGGGQQGTDFHGIWAVHDGCGASSPLS